MIESETPGAKLKVQVTRDTATTKLGKLGTFERKILLGTTIGSRALSLICKETNDNGLLVENRLCEVLEKDIGERGSLSHLYSLIQCREKSKSQRLYEILMNY
jgi:hypothetical protein